MESSRSKIQQMLEQNEFSLYTAEHVRNVLEEAENAHVAQEQLKAQLAEVTKRANSLTQRLGAVLVCLGVA